MDFINEKALFEQALKPSLDLARDYILQIILEAKQQFKDAEISISGFDIKIPDFKIRVKICD